MKNNIVDFNLSKNEMNSEIDSEFKNEKNLIK